MAGNHWRNQPIIRWVDSVRPVLIREIAEVLSGPMRDLLGRRCSPRIVTSGIVFRAGLGRFQCGAQKNSSAFGRCVEQTHAHGRVRVFAALVVETHTAGPLHAAARGTPYAKISRKIGRIHWEADS